MVSETTVAVRLLGDRCPPPFRSLIERCCAFLPEKRLKIAEVVAALEAMDVGGEDERKAEELIVGARVIVSRMKQPKYDNARGTVVDGKTPPGRVAVKFDNVALGTKAIRVGNIERELAAVAKNDDSIYAEDEDKPKPMAAESAPEPAEPEAKNDDGNDSKSQPAAKKPDVDDDTLADKDKPKPIECVSDDEDDDKDKGKYEGPIGEEPTTSSLVNKSICDCQCESCDNR